MDDFLDSLNKKERSLQDLTRDINAIIAKLEARDEVEDVDVRKEKHNKNFGKNKAVKVAAGYRSLEPMTRLRKDKQDIVKAEENPELTFIQDKYDDILGE